MSFAKWQACCLGPNVLICDLQMHNGIVKKMSCQIFFHPVMNFIHDVKYPQLPRFVDLGYIWLFPSMMLKF